MPAPVAAFLDAHHPPAAAGAAAANHSGVVAADAGIVHVLAEQAPDELSQLHKVP